MPVIQTPLNAQQPSASEDELARLLRRVSAIEIMNAYLDWVIDSSTKYKTVEDLLAAHNWTYQEWISLQT